MKKAINNKVTNNEVINMRLPVMFVIGLALGTPSFALAQGGAGSLPIGTAPPMEKLREGRFGFLDTNGDGYLTRDEIDADDEVLRSQFGSLDANGDGRLSPDEYTGVARRQ